MMISKTGKDNELENKDLKGESEQEFSTFLTSDQLKKEDSSFLSENETVENLDYDDLRAKYQIHAEGVKTPKKDDSESLQKTATFSQNLGTLCARNFRSFLSCLMNAFFALTFRVRGSLIRKLFGLIFLWLPYIISSIIFLLMALILLIIWPVSALFDNTSKALEKIEQNIYSNIQGFKFAMKSARHKPSGMRIVEIAGYIVTIFASGLMYITIKGVRIPIKSLGDIVKFLGNLIERPIQILSIFKGPQVANIVNQKNMRIKKGIKKDVVVHKGQVKDLRKGQEAPELSEKGDLGTDKASSKAMGEEGHIKIDEKDSGKEGGKTSDKIEEQEKIKEVVNGLGNEDVEHLKKIAVIMSPDLEHCPEKDQQERDKDREFAHEKKVRAEVERAVEKGSTAPEQTSVRQEPEREVVREVGERDFRESEQEVTNPEVGMREPEVEVRREEPEVEVREPEVNENRVVEPERGDVGGGRNNLERETGLGDLSGEVLEIDREIELGGLSGEVLEIDRETGLGDLSGEVLEEENRNSLRSANSVEPVTLPRNTTGSRRENSQQIE